MNGHFIYVFVFECIKCYSVVFVSFGENIQGIFLEEARTNNSFFTVRESLGDINSIKIWSTDIKTPNNRNGFVVRFFWLDFVFSSPVANYFSVYVGRSVLRMYKVCDRWNEINDLVVSNIVVLKWNEQMVWFSNCTKYPCLEKMFENREIGELFNFSRRHLFSHQTWTLPINSIFRAWKNGDGGDQVLFSPGCNGFVKYGRTSNRQATTELENEDGKM